MFDLPFAVDAPTRQAVVMLRSAASGMLSPKSQPKDELADIKTINADPDWGLCNL
jgi:hypothetical protein